MTYLQEHSEFAPIGVQELSFSEVALVHGGKKSGGRDAPGDARDLATGAGSAAGAAAGSRFGPTGAAIGGTIGGFLGGAIYDIAGNIDVREVSDPMDTKLGFKGR